MLANAVASLMKMLADNKPSRASALLQKRERVHHPAFPFSYPYLRPKDRLPHPRNQLLTLGIGQQRPASGFGVFLHVFGIARTGDDARHRRVGD